MTWIAAMKGAARRTERIARAKNVTTREITLLTGVFTTTMARAETIASPEAIAKTTSSSDIGFSPSLRGDERRDGDQVEEGEREEDLPAEVHELVVPEAGERPADPEEEEDEADRLHEEDGDRGEGAPDTRERHAGERPAS